MPPTVIWFSGWVLKLCFLLTQWIAGFDPFVPPKTSLFTVTSTQRWMQLDYGVTPIPQKRSRREVMTAWLQSVTAD
jgi:hypothetical protein